MPRTRARTVGAVAAAALFAAAAAGAVVAPWPQLEREPISVDAMPEPEASLLACAGPVIALGRDASDAAAQSDAAGQRVTVAAAGHADPAATRLVSPDVDAGAGPDAFSAPPEERVRRGLAAAGSVTVRADDLTGFAASACAPPLMESWLVGGSAGTGAADLVELGNPGEVAARVELTVYGADGAKTPAAGASVVVPAGAQRVLPLASIALGELTPVIRVVSSETPVQASLQASITRTLDPGGVDQVGVAAAPASSQVIPSVSVTRAPGDASSTDPSTIVRILAPWRATEATVTVTRVGADTPADTRTAPLQAGIPLELALDELPVGDYTVRVTAKESLVAAVWSTTGYRAGDDFAWYAAASPVGVPSLVAVAAGPAPALTLTNDSDRDVRAQVAADAGGQAPVEVTVPAGGSARTEVAAGKVYLLTPDGDGLRAEVSYTGKGALAGYAAIPADAAAAPLRVYPQ